MALEDNAFVYALAAAILVIFIYQRYLDFTRDVPPEYLELQAVIDSTRLPNELAIYKSTKLDYSSGLRVGLAIRYDHYKLRNGNLSDVWEIFLRCLRADPDRSIVVGGKLVGVAELNFQVHKVAEFLVSTSPSELWLPLSHFISSGPVLAVSVACFVTRTTLHLYDEAVATPDGLRVDVVDGEVQFHQDSGVTLFLAIIGLSQRMTDFENVYTPEKDKGIALRLTTQINKRISATTDFTQTNLVSAVASTIKCLPPNLELTPNDKLVVVQNVTTAENVTNSLVKTLTAFVTHSQLVLTWEDQNFMACNPTVLSATVPIVKSIVKSPTGIDTLFYRHRLFALSRLKFSNLFVRKPYPDLRLVFAHRSLKEGKYTDWNPFRAALGTQVVGEFGYFNVAGPLVTTDVHDYRRLPETVTSQISGFGAVVQANEFKLVNYNGVEPGDLHVRGYNIGKATTTMHNVGEKSIRPDKEGFYSFPLEARWGIDGCIYLMNGK